MEETAKFIIAEESGKWSQLEITEDKQTAAGLSSYKKRKHQEGMSSGTGSRLRSRSRSCSDKEDKDEDNVDTDRLNLGIKIIKLVEESLGVTIKKKRSRNQKTCTKSGKGNHSKNEVCPGAEAECRKCERVGHYARVCGSIKDTKSGEEENNALTIEELYGLEVKHGKYPKYSQEEINNLMVEELYTLQTGSVGPG